MTKTGDGHYHYLQTQFGEDRCTQFRVIVVTDSQTNRQERVQYTAPLSLAHSVKIRPGIVALAEVVLQNLKVKSTPKVL